MVKPPWIHLISWKHYFLIHIPFPSFLFFSFLFSFFLLFFYFLFSLVSVSHYFCFGLFNFIFVKKTKKKLKKEKKRRRSKPPVTLIWMINSNSVRTFTPNHEDQRLRVTYPSKMVILV
jgi:amino acid transporter